MFRYAQREVLEWTRMVLRGGAWRCPTQMKAQKCEDLPDDLARGFAVIH